MTIRIAIDINTTAIIIKDNEDTPVLLLTALSR